jgi:xanthine dehydrogenase accessory factor
MDERLFAELAVRLRHEAVVVASVIETRGATPRKPGARMLVCADATAASIGGGLAEARAVYAVLLNRDFGADIASLRELCARPPAFLGMMGSSRRIRQVIGALPEYADALQRLQAPIGLDIAAETPQEIAVSILAQLVQVSRRGGNPQ